MAKVVILGAGLGGVACAYEMKKKLFAADIAGRSAEARGTWNAICLADFGDTGAAFVALPQIPPRDVTWAREGKWVHVARIAFEKYFLRKVKTGSIAPIYEKYVLRTLRIEALKS